MHVMLDLMTVKSSQTHNIAFL